MWPFKTKITAVDCGHSLVAALLDKQTELAEFLMALGFDANDSSARWEVLALRSFAIDFATTWQTFGDTPTKKAILDAYYSGLLSALSQEALDFLKDRNTRYAVALQNPNNASGGPVWVLARTFASLVDRPDDMELLLTVGNLFSNSVQAVRETFAQFRIK